MLGRREIVADFSAEQITTDGGAALVRLAEQKTRIVERFAQCFRDYRNQDRIEHTAHELVAQRVIALVLGYEDLVDHDALRRDPLLGVAVGRHAAESAPLAGKSTLNRLELTTSSAASDRYKRVELDRVAAEDFFVEQFFRSHEQQVGKPPKRVTLDLDTSDVPLYGNQEGRFFHGYYNEYCYLPLYIFCGEHVLSVRLQRANADPARNAVTELRRIVRAIRAKWPKTKILVRGDSGFCRDKLFTWCEENGVDYVIGVARNGRLEGAIKKELAAAKKQHEESGFNGARVFKDLNYRTLNSWTRQRRVIAKAEWLQKGANPRFVVTTLPADEWEACFVYEKEYCPRGEMENRIKEQQLYLFGTRASSHTMLANQIRLYFSAVAYTLVQALRALGLRGTELAAARADTIRSKLLKIGARVTFSVRRVWIALSSACPYVATFAAAVANLNAVPAPS
jgi:hypothetical protein